MNAQVLGEISKMNEQEIFMAAARIENRDSRDDYLSEVCGDNVPLRRRVEALLAARERDDSLLDQPVARFEPTVGMAPNWDESEQIGPYKLREKLGEGGFGVVYVAEQSKPIRRKVALKVIKPGMDSKEVVARFEAERQALALMDHPNIARVLDAGVTAQGRPFFVMELVHGVPITEFCDKNNLRTDKRLELFRDVCRAVQHAHQKGVIHRDLKPSNVMVTLRDGEPIPKVIDFGVAKALSQQLTEKTVYTRYGQVIGTPQYMSPEQAEMNELGIDTRSDIYSLGVLLYELLTGRPPIETDRLVASGYAEMIRLICEEEPLRPSAKVSTLGQQATVIAGTRQTDPVSLSRSLSGELDWIVMKALDKNRERRYETANQFAADIQCFLANEPVQACPPTLTYRLGKTIRRNRRLVAAATTFVVLLCLGLVGTSIGMLRAQAAQEKEADARQVAVKQATDLDAKNGELQAAKAKAVEATKLERISRETGARWVN
ncbi:MAG: serine/threonine-protein kinase [Fuerstiella sp.]|mgnify:CR=1 FL=1